MFTRRTLRWTGSDRENMPCCETTGNSIDILVNRGKTQGIVDRVEVTFIVA